MADLQGQSYAEALDALSKVADGNGNRFKLKVVRRPNAASSVSQHIATFGEATWQHIADAESWLSTFSGGGLYILQVFDGADARRQYGTITPSEVTGPPRPPDPRVCNQASWIGPVLLSAGAVPANGTGAVVTGSPSFFNLGGEAFNGAAPRTPSDQGLASLFQAERAEIDRKSTELADRERKAELDAVKRAADERAKALEQRINDLMAVVAKPVAAPPGPDITAIFTMIAGVATPLVTALLTSAAEGRKAQLALEQARLTREEAREAAREAARREDANRPPKPLIDPQILEIMDRQAKRAEEQASQFSAFLKAQAEAGRANMESQSMAQRTMLQTIADVAQLQLKTGDHEGPGIDWGKIVAGVAQGLGALAQARGGAPGAPGMPGAAPGPLGAAPGLPGGVAAPHAPQGPLPEVEAAPALDAIEDRIRRKDPPDQIMLDLKAALGDPAVQAEIAAEGGLLHVFEARLDDFAGDQANAVYMGVLVKALQTSGVVEGSPSAA